MQDCPAGSETTGSHVRGSIVVSISACHAEDPDSIPGRGVFCCARAAATSQLHFLSVAVFPFRVFAIGGIAPCTGEKVGRSEMEDCGSELMTGRLRRPICRPQLWHKGPIYSQLADSQSLQFSDANHECLRIEKHVSQNALRRWPREKGLTRI